MSWSMSNSHPYHGLTTTRYFLPAVTNILPKDFWRTKLEACKIACKWASTMAAWTSLIRQLRGTSQNYQNLPATGFLVHRVGKPNMVIEHENSKSVCNRAFSTTDLISHDKGMGNWEQRQTPTSTNSCFITVWVPVNQRTSSCFLNLITLSGCSVPLLQMMEGLLYLFTLPHIASYPPPVPIHEVPKHQFLMASCACSVEQHAYTLQSDRHPL